MSDEAKLGAQNNYNTHNTIPAAAVHCYRRHAGYCERCYRSVVCPSFRLHSAKATGWSKLPLVTCNDMLKLCSIVLDDKERLRRSEPWQFALNLTLSVIGYMRTFRSWRCQVSTHSHDQNLPNFKKFLPVNSRYIDIYTVSQKTVQNCFCQNFVKCLSTLIIFGKRIAQKIGLCKVHSFSTSPN